MPTDFTPDPRLHEQTFQLLTQEAGFTVQGLDDPAQDEVVVSGFAARYGSPFMLFEYEGYEFWRQNEPGMFARSLSRNPTVFLRKNHQDAFAKTQAGNLRLEERAEGLWFQATVDRRNPDAQAMLVEMARGTLAEASVAYRITAQRRVEEERDGLTVATQYTTEGDLAYGDVSVVDMGANPAASSWIGQSIRSEAAARRVVQTLTDRFPALADRQEPPMPEAQEPVEQTDKNGHLLARLRVLDLAAQHKKFARAEPTGSACRT